MGTRSIRLLDRFIQHVASRLRLPNVVTLRLQRWPEDLPLPRWTILWPLRVVQTDLRGVRLFESFQAKGSLQSDLATGGMPSVA